MVVLSKYYNGQTTIKILRHLNGGIGLTTIKRWCQMIRHSGSFKLSSPPDGPRFATMKGNIQKIKHHFYAERKEYQLENYRWSSVSPREMFGE